MNTAKLGAVAYLGFGTSEFRLTAVVIVGKTEYQFVGPATNNRFPLLETKFIITEDELATKPANVCGDGGFDLGHEVNTPDTNSPDIDDFRVGDVEGGVLVINNDTRRGVDADGNAIVWADPTGFSFELDSEETPTVLTLTAL